MTAVKDGLGYKFISLCARRGPWFEQRHWSSTFKEKRQPIGGIRKSLEIFITLKILKI